MKYFGIGNSHSEKGDVEVLVGYDDISLELQTLKVVNSGKLPVRLKVGGQKIEVFGSTEFPFPIPTTLEKTAKEEVGSFPEGSTVSVTY